MSLTKTSKQLSYLLRHSQEPLYIDLDGGWASVDTILVALNISREILEEIVDTDSKGRYSFDDTGRKIRANQGHSIPNVVVSMESPVPPEFLYHGTATKFLDDILKDGLKPMSRQWVHISPDIKTAVMVGKRHGNPIVLTIRAKDFVRDGHELFRSSNGVWQAKAIPQKYFDVCYIQDKEGVNMNVVYKGVELEGLDKKVHLISSVAMASMGQDNNENTDYLSRLYEYKRADLPKAQFDEINKLHSVVKMNYQICNGGIYQYFGNKYHKHYLSADKETELFDKDTQVEMLRKLYAFAEEVFPNNRIENSKLLRMIEFFDSLSFEEMVPQYGTIYSDEEIWDEDLEEYVPNPDYEEPYEDIVDYEDELSTSLAGFYADDFDDEYYQINEYLEKIIEGYAQFIEKSFEKERSQSVDERLANASARAGETKVEGKAEIEKEM